MLFALFLALNAVLFLRPGELIPGMAAWPIYQVLILVCWVCYLPAALETGNLGRLFGHPLTWCMLGLEATVWLSHLANGRTFEARQGGVEFAKIVFYYLLLLGVVNTPETLQKFLLGFLGLITILSVVTVLQFHEIINVVPNSLLLEQHSVNPDTGEFEYVSRLRSFGQFNDPNDYCLILFAGTTICAYRLGNSRAGQSRYLFLLPAALFAYALILTQSRGGLLAFLLGALSYVWIRWGWRRTLLIGIAFLPVLLVARGRIASISTGEETAQERIGLWSEALVMFRQRPLQGVGENQFAEQVGLVCHNSFIQSFVELGFFGGTCFLGLFYIAGSSLLRLTPDSQELEEGDEFARFRPYLFGLIIGYASGLLSLSRNYSVPTYLIFGLAAAYLQMANQRRGIAPFTGIGRALGESAVASVIFLIAMYGFVQVAISRV